MSGYISGHCPSSDAQKLLSLQATLFIALFLACWVLAKGGQPLAITVAAL